MNKLFLIIKREYSTRVKSKGFIAGTILTPLLFALLILLPTLVTGKIARSNYTVAVLDQTGEASIYQRAEGLLNSDNERLGRFQMRREAISVNQLEARRQELNNEISKGILDVYVVVPTSVLNEGRITYHTKHLGDLIAETRVENAFSTAVAEQRMRRAGIDPKQIGELNQKLVMEKFNERGEGEVWGRVIMAFLLLGVLSLTVFAYGGSIMSAVIEEKQSRLMEVLASSVAPFPLLLGKLIGVGLVGLTQYSIWAGCAILLSVLTASQSAFGRFGLPQISLSLMGFFVVFFLLGYFLYATLYATVGALVSDEEDGQRLQIPLMMLIFLALGASSFVWRQPDSSLAVAISLFPFFTPFAMFLRIAIQQPPSWQILLAIVSTLATILGAVWIAAKLYRVGVLMYGKPPTVPELVKWLKYS